jgi:hypothetical protein
MDRSASIMCIGFIGSGLLELAIAAGILLAAAIAIFGSRHRGDVAPEAIADALESLLNGTYDKWAVDDYEHLNPRAQDARELWERSMLIGGLPEAWSRLEPGRKQELRAIADRLRQLTTTRR